MDADKLFEELSTDDPKAIAAMLSELRETLAPLAKEIEEANNARKAYDGAIESHRKAIDDLRSKQHSIDESVWDAKRRMRELDRKLRSAERRYEESLALEAQREELARLSDEFDRLTAGAPWREFAFDHQITGAKKLAAQKRAILADKRGLGKTLTSLVYLDMVQARKIIAVVPNDTQDNFLREMSHWAPHRAKSAIKLGGMAKGERDVLINMVLPSLPEYFIVINFEAWRRDNELVDGLVNLQPDTIIIDEAHNAKNRKTKAYKGLRSFITKPNKCPSCASANVGSAVDRWDRLSNVSCRDCGFEPQERDFFAFNSVEHVLPMTGTPILNRPQDLFSLLSLIDPVHFNSERNFLYDYCMQGYDNKWRFRPGGLERLTKQLAARFVMRDRHSAGVEIPPQEIQYYNLTLDPIDYPKQYEAAKALSDRAMILLEGEKGLPVPYIIALITRKRQMMTWGEAIEFKDRNGVVVFKADCDESIKLDKVIKLDTGNGPEGLIPELVGERDDETGRWVDGERVVVFSQFRAPLRVLAERCAAAGISAAIMDGDTPQEKRDEIARDFDVKTADPNNYKYQVVLANYKVGGVGLNLNAASQMIIVDEEWNPGKVDQAYGRIDRMGQTKETTVHVLRVNNSIDTWMAALIGSKQDMIGGFEESIDLQQKLLDGLQDGML